MYFGKKSLKAIAIGVAMIIVAAYAALGASAAMTATTTTTTFGIELAENSVYTDVTVAKISHMEVTSGRSTTTYRVFVENDRFSKEIDVSSKDFARLHEGDNINLVKREGSRWKIAYTPKTETYVKDVVKEDGKYFAVISDNGEIQRIKISAVHANDLSIGQDVVLGEKKDGSAYIEGYTWGGTLLMAVGIIVIVVLIGGFIFYMMYLMGM